MIKEFQEKKYTIAPDWVEFMLIGEIKPIRFLSDNFLKINDKIVLKSLGHGTRSFIYLYELYYHGELFAEIKASPRNNAILADDYIQFKVVNPRLYEKDWISTCEVIFQQMHLRVRNISRLDIAMDGKGFMDVITRFDDDKTLDCVNSKIKWSPYKQGRKIIGFDWGRRKSRKKYLVGYDKSKEIEQGTKKYIADFWLKSGLITDIQEQGIDRLELRLYNDGIKKIKNFDWKKIGDSKYLASIFRTQIKGWFEFRKASRDTCITRKKKYEFIDWKSIGAVLLEKNTARPTNEVFRLKQTCKTLFWLYLGTKRKYYLKMCKEVAANVNCQHWFGNKRWHWEKEFEKLNKNATFTYIPIWKEVIENEQLVLVNANDILINVEA